MSTLSYVAGPPAGVREGLGGAGGNNACVLELGEESSPLTGTTQSFLVAITTVFMFAVYFKLKKFLKRYLWRKI